MLFRDVNGPRHRPIQNQTQECSGFGRGGVITRSQCAHLSQCTHCKQPLHKRCPQLGRGGFCGRAPFAPRRNEKSDPGVAESFWLSGVKNGGGHTVSVGARHPQKPERSTMPENEEASPTAEAQQDAVKASDELSCRTRLIGPLLILGALVGLAQPKPAKAQNRYPQGPRPRCGQDYYMSINRGAWVCAPIDPRRNNPSTPRK